MSEKALTAEESRRLLGAGPPIFIGKRPFNPLELAMGLPSKMVEAAKAVPPLVQQARELCWAIEALPASEQQTEVSIKASELLGAIQRSLMENP